MSIGSSELSWVDQLGCLSTDGLAFTHICAIASSATEESTRTASVISYDPCSPNESRGRVHERDDGAAAEGAEQSASNEDGGVGVA
jgi:hypothetical protein